MGADLRQSADLGRPSWLRSITDLPIILKGICHPEDVRRAKDGGVDAVYCSNHGGLQANGGLPALEALPGVVEAADGLPVLFDSGVRTGADVGKALTLGATAVGVGRPYAYGLAVGGSGSPRWSGRCARTLPRVWPNRAPTASSP